MNSKRCIHDVGELLYKFSIEFETLGANRSSNGLAHVQASASLPFCGIIKWLWPKFATTGKGAFRTN